MSTDAQVIQQQVPAESTEELIQPVPGSDGTAAASATTEDGETTQPEKSAEGGQKGINRRFAKLSGQLAAKDAEAEYWRNKALGGDGKEKPAAVTEAPAKPNEADFETTGDYLEALTDWKAEEKFHEFRAEEEEKASTKSKQAEEEKAALDWNGKKAAFAKDHDDYKDVTDAALAGLRDLHPDVANAISDLILDSDMGPQLLFHLGSNLEELEQFAELSPRKAAKALWQIEARLAGDNPGDTVKVPPQTRAPRPPTPIKKSSPGSDSGEIRDDLPDDEFKRRLLKKMEMKRE